METKHYFSYLQATMQKHWDDACMVNLDGTSPYTYRTLATAIARLDAQFEAIGIKPGDKVALAGINSANWGMSFLAITAYRAVAVSILPDFTAEDIANLVAHSEAKLLLVGPNVRRKVDLETMPGLIGTIFLDELSMIHAKEEATITAFNEAGAAFDAAHPEGIALEDIHYPTDNMDDLALINYTSGSTGNPKGVMLTYLNLSHNVHYAIYKIPHREGDHVLSMLPIAHMFGLMFEFLYPICEATHITFLTQQPTPTILMKAFAEVKPYMILTVPLVIEKIIRKSVFPVIKKPWMKVLWHTPGIKNVLRRKVNEKLMNAFGGNLRHLIIGGAALNLDVEQCLRDIKLPYCVGYGMTECAPLLSYSPWDVYRMHSCGQPIDGMEFRIDSSDQYNVDGEVQVRGFCVMKGYYKNPEATKATFTNDGWMRTGDLGVLDKDGFLYLRGRSKNMILGASGQNIYPEEIEDKLNAFHYVVESVVIAREGKIVALVYPDYQGGLDKEQLRERLEANRRSLNHHLPQYSQVSAIEMVETEFEKTPKKSIKRYLYK